jgi:hypothetical protein
MQVVLIISYYKYLDSTFVHVYSKATVRLTTL